MVRYITFYGTLKSTHSTALSTVINAHLRYIGKCVIPGKLYRMPRYPALKPGNGRVMGELYEILDVGALSDLDAYEAIDNVNPSLPGFSRKLVQLIEPYQQSWVYYYDGSVEDNTFMPSGEWN